MKSSWTKQFVIFALYGSLVTWTFVELKEVKVMVQHEKLRFVGKGSSVSEAG